MNVLFSFWIASFLVSSSQEAFVNEENRFFFGEGGGVGGYRRIGRSMLLIVP